MHPYFLFPLQHLIIDSGYTFVMRYLMLGFMFFTLTDAVYFHLFLIVLCSPSLHASWQQNKAERDRLIIERARTKAERERSFDDEQIDDMPG